MSNKPTKNNIIEIKNFLSFLTFINLIYFKIEINYLITTSIRHRFTVKIFLIVFPLIFQGWGNFTFSY